MRIEVDFELCESNAVCVGMAPDVFGLDDDDGLVINIDEIPPNQLAELKEVAGSCPRAAIAIVD
jgi:ferredoxin